MCGIIGIYGQSHVASRLYDGLILLQHRGQDAAGMAVGDGRRVLIEKGNGLVADVFTADRMNKMQGHLGIAHCRYPTAGSEGSDESQPFYVNSPYGIALGHNGNLINTESLRQEVFEQDRRNINTGSDSEVLLNVFAHELDQAGALSPQAAFDAISTVHQRCVGGYAVVTLVMGLGLVAFRDPNGIRPLVLGRRMSEQGVEYAVASETVALDGLGFERVKDIAPGEAVVITEAGELHSQSCAKNAELTPCLFEFVYFARPDSMIDNVSVHKARMRMGVTLAEKISRAMPEHDIDVVIPIPDTSRTSAMELANALGVKYREGFIKNRYIGRTFIMPGQGERTKSVRRKLNPIPLEFKDRVVLLVDDSIVRGTTSSQIIQMAREAGAKKVYFASAAPPVRHPNIYGIDMPIAKELIAAGRSEEEVRELLGCDALFYQDIHDLEQAVRGKKERIQRFDSSCFTGEYVTPVDDDYLGKLEAMRSDVAKQHRRGS